MADPKEIELEPGYYFSPGFYTDFWIKYIENKFPEDVRNSHVKLKQYREMWVGAIFAAAQTKITGIKHFVGLPEREPPDVDVVRFVPTTTAKGNKGTKIQRMPIEITRCDLDSKETLFGQIVKKNKQAYEGNILMIYIYGIGRDINFDETVKKLKELDKIYPDEIVVIGKVDKTTTGIVFPQGTFVQTKLYPDGGQDLVNVLDRTAFFRAPEVMTALHRGVSTKLKPIGSMVLKAPKINERSRI